MVLILNSPAPPHPPSSPLPEEWRNRIKEDDEGKMCTHTWAARAMNMTNIHTDSERNQLTAPLKATNQNSTMERNP